jgi:hypothetical protein
MKHLFILILAFLFLPCGFVASAEGAVSEDEEGPGAVVIQKERGLLDWTANYIETKGTGVVPKGMKGAQGKALARRGAIVDLQRNFLEFLGGVQIDSRTTMDDFMAEDRVRSEVHGMIQNVELLDGEWDGESYTVSGRIRMAQIRVVVAPSLQVTPAKEPVASGGVKYTGLIIDARHLPLTPAMTFVVRDGSGRAVYGIDFVDQSYFLRSGLCAYYNNISYARGEIFVANNPIVARAVKLASGNVDIVISDSDAAKVRGSSHNFRRECKVIVVTK